jgi:hypothetical protein
MMTCFGCCDHKERSGGPASASLEQWRRPTQQGASSSAQTGQQASKLQEMASKTDGFASKTSNRSRTTQNSNAQSSASTEERKGRSPSTNTGRAPSAGHRAVRYTDGPSHGSLPGYTKPQTDCQAKCGKSLPLCPRRQPWPGDASTTQIQPVAERSPRRVSNVCPSQGADARLKPFLAPGPSTNTPRESSLSVASNTAAGTPTKARIIPRPNELPGLLKTPCDGTQAARLPVEAAGPSPSPGSASRLIRLGIEAEFLLAAHNRSKNRHHMNNFAKTVAKGHNAHTAFENPEYPPMRESLLQCFHPDDYTEWCLVTDITLTNTGRAPCKQIPFS